MDGKEQRTFLWIAFLLILTAVVVVIVRYETRPRQIYGGSQPLPSSATPVSGELIEIDPFQQTPRSSSVSPVTPSATLPQPTLLQTPTSAADILIIAIDPGIYPDQRSSFNAEIKQALAYVQERFGSSLVRPINVDVVQNQECSLEGLSYPDVRRLQVYTCSTINRSRAVDIMAHEFVHLLAYDRYGEKSQGADTILVEGVATWAAGRYWLNNQPDFRAYVRQQYNNGVSAPLLSTIDGASSARLNILYYQWASFVEFLITIYGRDSFDKVYMTGPESGESGSADYMSVYGKSIEVLEQEWQIWLR